VFCSTQIVPNKKKTQMKGSICVFFILAALLVSCAIAVNLPGLPRKTYKKGQDVQVKTRKLSSVRNLPFPFYHLKFCKPEQIIDSAENLGEFLFGDRIQNSVYEVCAHIKKTAVPYKQLI